MKKHMKSRWYEEQVKEGFEARLENKNKTPKTMIGMAVFFIVIFVILYVVHVNDPNYEFGTSCAFVGGMAVFIFAIVGIAQAAANKKTADFSLPDL